MSAPAGAIDIVGTGGDGHGTLNISTLAALIVAACGVPVAKHGNRAASSKSGSSDVLTALGVGLDLAPAQVEACIKEAGIGFMAAQTHHASDAVCRARAGRARHPNNFQSPWSRSPIRPASNTKCSGFLPGIGSNRSPMCCAISDRKMSGSCMGPTVSTRRRRRGPSFVTALENGKIRSFQITPRRSRNCPRVALNDLSGGDPAANAAAPAGCSGGARKPYRDIAILNAAAGPSRGRQGC